MIITRGDCKIGAAHGEQRDEDLQRIDLVCLLVRLRITLIELSSIDFESVFNGYRLQ
jgi:hypothetical protein